MKPKVSSKLLILFGLICGIFFYAESGFCANVYSRNASEDLESIEDKSSSFSAKLNKTQSATSAESESALAQKIRAQRAALDAKDKQSVTAQKTKSGATKNNCDTNLRKCIASKCGSEYEKCETDSDTIFSDKLNACKKEADCTAREFTLFTNEIKADKNQTISLSSYNKVIACGNAYNDCIITECGKKFNKCLSKSAGDKAIAKCKNIATECTEADSGLVGRIGNIFGIVRQDAEKQIKADEQKLYSLRKQMKDSCSMLGSGAMFDERSLDCVFTVNFFAGDDKKTPKASKKLYAGSTFNCSPDWFGIDVTTFKENAYRATRAQTAASSAMLGSGVGMAVGAITSGAISRAIDTKKAKDALEDACAEENMIIKDDKCFCDAGDKTGLVKQGDKCVCKDANKTYNKKSGKCENGEQIDDDDNDEPESQEPELTPQEKCEQAELKGEFKDNKCDCSKLGSGVKEENGICVNMKKKEICVNAGGKLNIFGKCVCKNKGEIMQDGKCTATTTNNNSETPNEDDDAKCEGKIANASRVKSEDGKCIPLYCNDGYKVQGNECVEIPTIASVCKKYGGIQSKNDCDCKVIPIANSREKCQQEIDAIKATTKQQINDVKVSMKCKSTGGKPNPLTGCVCPGNKIASDGDCEKLKKDQTQKKAEETCRSAGGNYENGKCVCSNGDYDEATKKCIVKEQPTIESQRVPKEKCLEQDLPKNATEGHYITTGRNDLVCKNNVKCACAATKCTTGKPNQGMCPKKKQTAKK
jgi:hypothetical protein